MPELAQPHHLELSHLARKLHRDHPVALFACFPYVRHEGGDDYQIHARKRLLTRPYYVRAIGMQHQVDLIFRVAVYGVIELGIVVVEHHEKVVALDGRDFLLYVFHSRKCK